MHIFELLREMAKSGGGRCSLSEFLIVRCSHDLEPEAYDYDSEELFLKACDEWAATFPSRDEMINYQAREADAVVCLAPKAVKGLTTRCMEERAWCSVGDGTLSALALFCPMLRVLRLCYTGPYACYRTRPTALPLIT